MPTPSCEHLAACGRGEQEADVRKRCDRGGRAWTSRTSASPSARRAILLLLSAIALIAVVPGAGRAQTVVATPPPAGLKTAIFAGGCFWCMVHPFDELDGVTQVLSGYTGGVTLNPTYEQVSSGETQHREAVRVTYDPAKISYERLLEVYWRNVDPLNGSGQFCDHGPQYTAAIFVANTEQRLAAEKTRREVEQRFAKTVAVMILPVTDFYVAEDYHQDYYKKNPIRYKFYRFTCGRDNQLEKLWGHEARDGQPRPGL
jgi:peptide-methionine (S)-S-oxide reductase